MVKFDWRLTSEDFKARYTYSEEEKAVEGWLDFHDIGYVICNDSIKVKFDINLDFSDPYGYAELIYAEFQDKNFEKYNFVIEDDEDSSYEAFIALAEKKIEAAFSKESD